MHVSVNCCKNNRQQQQPMQPATAMHACGHERPTRCVFVNTSHARHAGLPMLDSQQCEGHPDGECKMHGGAGVTFCVTFCTCLGAIHCTTHELLAAASDIAVCTWLYPQGESCLVTFGACVNMRVRCPFAPMHCRCCLMHTPVLRPHPPEGTRHHEPVQTSSQRLG